jgi:hypothetical protein
MTPSPPRGPLHGRLDSWKAIAAYLHHDVSTVMRWENFNGLPVRRIPGRGRSVFAFTEEIDRWLGGNRDVIAPIAIAAPLIESRLAHPRYQWLFRIAMAIASVTALVLLARSAVAPAIIVRASPSDALGGDIDGALRDASQSLMPTVGSAIIVEPGANNRLLYASGVSDAFAGSIIAVFDPRDVTGSSPGRGSLPACANCPKASGRVLCDPLV